MAIFFDKVGQRIFAPGFIGVVFMIEEAVGVIHDQCTGVDIDLALVNKGQFIKHTDHSGSQF